MRRTSRSTLNSARIYRLYAEINIEWRFKMKIKIFATLLLAVIILMVSPWPTNAIAPSQTDGLARINGSVQNLDGDVFTDFVGEIYITGYSYPNTPAWEYLQQSIPLIDGEFESELPPGVYRFWVRNNSDLDKNHHFNYFSHQEIEPNSEVNLVFRENNPNATLYIKYIDHRTGEPVNLEEIEIWAESLEVAGGIFVSDSTEEGYPLVLPEGKWTITPQVEWRSSEYALIDPRELVVELEAGEPTVAEVRVALRDSQFAVKVEDLMGNPQGMVLSMSGIGGIEGVGYLLSPYNEDGSFEIQVPTGTYKVATYEERSVPAGLKIPEPFYVTVSPATGPDPYPIILYPWESRLFGSVKLNGLSQDETITMVFNYGPTDQGERYPLELISDGKDAIGTFNVPRPTQANSVHFESDTVYVQHLGGIVDVEGVSEYNFEGDFLAPNEIALPLSVLIGMSPSLPLELVLENRAKVLFEANTVAGFDLRSISLTGWYASPLNRSLAPHGLTYALSFSPNSLRIDPFLMGWEFEKSVQVELPYDPALLSTGDPAEIRIYRSYMDEFTAPDSIDTENQTVSFSVDRYSTFGLMMQGDGSNVPNSLDVQSFLPIVR